MELQGAAMVLLAGQQTCDSQVAGLSPGAPLCVGFRQATYICVPLWRSSLIWYRPRGVIPLAGKVTGWWKAMAAYHRVY